MYTLQRAIFIFFYCFSLCFLLVLVGWLVFDSAVLSFVSFLGSCTVNGSEWKNKLRQKTTAELHVIYFAKVTNFFEAVKGE